VRMMKAEPWKSGAFLTRWGRCVRSGDLSGVAVGPRALISGVAGDLKSDLSTEGGIGSCSTGLVHVDELFQRRFRPANNPPPGGGTSSGSRTRVRVGTTTAPPNLFHGTRVRQRMRLLVSALLGLTSAEVGRRSVLLSALASAAPSPAVAAHTQPPNYFLRASLRNSAAPGTWSGPAKAALAEATVFGVTTDGTDQADLVKMQTHLAFKSISTSRALCPSGSEGSRQPAR
jgi:hypothetical protein